MVYAQQPVYGPPQSGFDPYAAQPGVVPYTAPQPSVVPGPVLPPANPVVIEQTLPVYPAAVPVRFVWYGEFLYLCERRGDDELRRPCKWGRCSASNTTHSDGASRLG